MEFLCPEFLISKNPSEFGRTFYWKEVLSIKVLKGQQGFSLVELLVAMAVMVALLAIGIPNYSKWIEKHRIEAESQKLYLDLLLARTSAIKNNNNVIVTFNPGANSYQVHDDTNSNGTVDGGEQVKSVPLQTGVQFGINGSVPDIDNNTILGPIFLGGASTNTALTFTPRGESDLSGSVYLIPSGDVGEHNGRVKGVSIVQATGGVDLWKYDSSASPPWS